jgi:hypothetical protein
MFLLFLQQLFPMITDSDKFARFLFEYHSHRFESLDLPQLPADRSDFDVHGALLDDKVQNKCHTLRFNKSCPLLCSNILLYLLYLLFQLFTLSSYNKLHVRYIHYFLPLNIDFLA